MFNPRFVYTNQIVKDLMSIERSKLIVEMLPIPAQIEQELKEQAKLKMTHFSTRIEGNPLSFDQVTEVVKLKSDRTKLQAEHEVRNYWEALTFISGEAKKNTMITEKFIKELHAIIDNKGTGRRSKESKYRGATPPGVLFAVYDTKTKRPDYIPPEWSDVPTLMKDLIKWINEENLLPIPIKAAIVAYQLLTIHPFEDGNGRTSRALSTFILTKEGYDLRGFNSMEEYYVSDLDGYYKNIQMGLPALYYDGRNNPKNLAPWLEYFVRIMAYAFERVANTAQKTTLLSKIDPRIKKLDLKEKALLRLLLDKNGVVKVKDIADVFGVTPRAISNWTKDWVEKGLIEPASGTQRITAYKIGESYKDLSFENLGYIEV
jgi:Fic family protein